MSVTATRFVWELDLSKFKKKSTKRLVLLALADRANNEGVCFPSVARLCQDTCLDRKTVMSTVNDLIEDGLLVDTGDRKGATKQVRVLQIKMFAVDNSKNTPVEQCEISQTTVPNLPNKSTEFPLNSTKSGTRNLKQSKKETKIESLDVKIENENVLTTPVELDETTLLLIEEQAQLEGKSTQEVADQYAQQSAKPVTKSVTQNSKAVTKPKEWIPKEEYKAMKQAEFKQQQNKEMVVSKAMQESFKQGFSNPNATKGIPADVLEKLPSFLKKRIK